MRRCGGRLRLHNQPVPPDDASAPSEAAPRAEPSDFIRDAIREDLKSGRFDRVHTRFPPEPNAYLHIGHAKAIWINYGIAQEFGGQFNLRFDDTNPLKEEAEYVEAIVRDVEWVLSAARESPSLEGGGQGVGGRREQPSFEGDADPGPAEVEIQAGRHAPSTPQPPPSKEGEIPSEEGETPGSPRILGPFFASDYFEQMFQWACELIEKGKAFVCDQTAEEILRDRGTLTQPGKESPFRERLPEESLDLFRRMRAGEFPDGSKTLRAKIDMAHPNILMRDPVMYRIRHAHHHRQGDAWCIYPMYDWAHGLEDSIEGVTHSLCSLEYEVHRPLYDWYLDQLGIYHPRQIEFARSSLTYTVMSKRRFIELVEGGHVSGLDDPRLPTLAGARRRGYTPEAIADFCRRIGVAGKSKVESVVDMALLQDCVREDLNRRAPRRMAVLNPLKVVITNYVPPSEDPQSPTDLPDNRQSSIVNRQSSAEFIEAVNNPEDASAGTRQVPFGREIWIEREDFREDPPPKFFRLAPGREVRLRYAYFIRCEEVVKDASGEIVELRCTYDPATKGGDAPDGRKVKATLHWVAAETAIPFTARLYDHLFKVPHPDDLAEELEAEEEALGETSGLVRMSSDSSGPEGARTNPNQPNESEPTRTNPSNYLKNLNPDSLKTVTGWAEPSLAEAKEGDTFQFERLGYFCLDPDSEIAKGDRRKATDDEGPEASEDVSVDSLSPIASRLSSDAQSPDSLSPIASRLSPLAPRESPIANRQSPPLIFNRTATLRDTWANIEKRLD